MPRGKKKKKSGLQVENIKEVWNPFICTDGKLRPRKGTELAPSHKVGCSQGQSQGSGRIITAPPLLVLVLSG